MIYRMLYIIIRCTLSAADNNLEFSLKIFAECGLCRLVKNELKKINYESRFKINSWYKLF